MSLKTEIIMRSSERHLRAQAMSAFESLLFVMVLSMTALVPLARARLTGTMLMVLGAVGIVRALRHVVADGRGRANPTTVLLRRRLILPILAHVLIEWSGFDLIVDRPNGVFPLFAAMLWLLVTATRGAWELLVEVGESKT